MDQIFLSSKDIGIFLIATGMVVTATKMMMKLLEKVHPKFWALLFSLIIAVANVIANDKRTWLDFVLIVFNTAMLFCAALGLNETIATSKTHNAITGGPPPPPWWRGSWL